MRLNGLLAILLAISAAHAQSTSVWRYWGMADGLYESYIHSAAAGPGNVVWVTHGRNIPSATILDGYNSRKVGLQAAVRPFDRVFGEPGGWAWGLTAQGFRLFDPRKNWSDRPVSALQGASTARPLGTDHALVLTAHDLFDYDFGHDAARLLWDGSGARIGTFADFIGDPDHDVWIAGESGAGRLRKSASGGWEWTEYPQWPEKLEKFRKLAAGAAGEVFVTATAAGGGSVILEYAGGRWSTIYRTTRAKAAAWAGADDIVWIQDGDSLYSLQEGRLQRLDRTAIQSDSITDVSPESGGAFWVGTYDGLARNAPQLWRTPAGARAIDSSVYGIVDDGAGGLWVVTATRLFHESGKRWESIAIPEAWTPLVFRSDSLVVLRDGSLTVTGPGHRLLHFDPPTKQFREIEAPGGLSVDALTPRGDGTAWAVTRTQGQPGIQLNMFDGTFHAQGPPLEWDVSGVLSVRQASDGAIWIGGTNELKVYRNGKLSTIGRPEGYTDTGVFSIVEVRPGRLWVGGRSKLFEFDGRQWKVLRDADRTRLILPARDGSVWVAASDGIYRYQDGTWLDYGLEEGLPSSIGFTVHEDAARRIWVGTTLGLSMFHPEGDLGAPRAYIPEHQNAAKVGRGEARLLFAGVDRWKYTPSDRLLFSYRMDRGPWTPFAENQPAEYPDLDTGAHHFEVRAMDRAGNISLQPAAFDFSVVPPWYLTGGFLLAAGLGSAVIAGLLMLLVREFRGRGKLIGQLTLAQEEAGRQQEAIKLSESRFRGLLESAPDAMVIVNQQGRIVLINSQAEKLFGYHRDELVGASLETLVPERFRERHVDHRAMYGSAPQARPMGALLDLHARHKDGHEIPVEVSLSPLAVGSEVWISSSIRDSTYRRLREKELKNQAELLNLAHDAIIVRDLHARIVSWNRGAEQLYGWSAEEAEGQDVHRFLHTVWPMPVEAVYAAIQERGSWEGEVRQLRRDGKEILVECRQSLYREDGVATSVMEINRDITERKNFERQLEASRIQAVNTARLSALGEMAAGIAHEVNNPLAIISGSARNLVRLVQHGELTAEGMLKQVARITQTSDRIARIVKSLRHIARDDSNDEFRSVRASEIVEECLELCGERFRVNSVRLLRPEIDPRIAIRCREAQIGQVLLNLLQNAFDAVVETEGERWVRLEASARGDRVVFAVSDSGPGVPPEIRSRIMEPFFTTKPAGKGTGLGLSLSRSIAEAHSGTLELSSEPGPTRFLLTLWLADEE